MRPSQTASNSARDMSTGRGDKRILNENLILAGFAEKEKTAVAQHRDAGQRRLGQPPPVRSIDPRLEPEFLGAAQHFGHANCRAEAVADLLGIGADAVEPQQQDQSREPRLARRLIIGSRLTPYPLSAPWRAPRFCGYLHS